MSADEWFTFISPFVWILLILNVMALFPIPFKKAQMASRVTFTIGLGVIIALIGWFMALIAIHTMTPIIRINILQSSQLVLSPMLVILAVTLVLRLFQGNNLLVTLLKGLCRFLMSCLHLLALILPIIFHILAVAFSSRNQEEELKIRKKDEIRDKIHINWKGEYSGEDDWNKY